VRNIIERIFRLQYTERKETMVGTLFNKGATLAVLSFYPINPSTAFIITPSPLYPTTLPPPPSPRTTATPIHPPTTTHLLKLFATNVDNEKDEVVASSSFPKTIPQSQAVLDEASDALQSVGWSSPMADAELTSDDPFVQRIEAQILEESGVGLEELLNPAKVINLERDLYNLRSELASLTGKPSDFDVLGLSTEECNGRTNGGEKADGILQNIEKKERSLYTERRAVFRGWLKNVFLGQAVLSLGLSAVMVTDPGLLFGGFDWFRYNSMDVSIKVLGFWWWWLFIIPSLRSRRPSGFEKKALDIAFLVTPAISITAPIVTKDQALIWGANLVVVAGSYGFAYLTYDEASGERKSGKEQPDWLKFIYSSLDFGSGKERGLKK